MFNSPLVIVLRLPLNVLSRKSVSGLDVWRSVDFPYPCGKVFAVLPLIIIIIFLILRSLTRNKDMIECALQNLKVMNG